MSKSNRLHGQLNQIRRIDLKNADIDIIKQQLIPLIADNHITVIPISNPERLYRIVRIEAPPLNMARVGYPPPELTLQHGRANRIGNPIFYASASPLVALSETAKHSCDTFAISEWKLKEPVNLVTLGYEKLSDKSKAEIAKHPRYWVKQGDDVTAMQKIKNRFIEEQFLRVVAPGDSWGYKNQYSYHRSNA